MCRNKLLSNKNRNKKKLLKKEEEINKKWHQDRLIKKALCLLVGHSLALAAFDKFNFNYIFDIIQNS